MTILCYISLPDGQIYQVECGNKCYGHECLEKICRLLGIVAEIEYFGLQYRGSKGELYWLNTKNRLTRQLPGHPPYRLLFKVKYFASPHLLLEEETRHQFFINCRWYLTQGIWLESLSRELKARFIALLAQARLGDYSPMTPSSRYLELWQPKRDDYWTIAESNMLGRKNSITTDHKLPSEHDANEHRSSLVQQPSNPLPSSIDPHLTTDTPTVLPHDTGVDEVFLESNMTSPTNNSQTNSPEDSDEELSGDEMKVREFRMIAGFHQELVDLEPTSAAYRFVKLAASSLPYYGTVFYKVRDCFDNPLLLGVGPEAIFVTTPDKKLVNRYPYTSVQKITESNRVFFLVVRHQHDATTSVSPPNPTPPPRELGFQLASQRAASALYRAVTETHCFFCCETVRNDVATQMSRGVRVALTALMQLADTDHNKGKEYVFDIRITFRELYDMARRQFYLSSANLQQQIESQHLPENQVSLINQNITSRHHQDTSSDSSHEEIHSASESHHPENTGPSTTVLNHPKSDSTCPGSGDGHHHQHKRVRNNSATSGGSTGSDNASTGSDHCVTSHKHSCGDVIPENLEQEVKQLRAELARQEDSCLCQVCMERELSRVFTPCGHLVCCGECALKVDQCPLCRADIKKRCPIFLPWNTPMSMDQEN